MSSATRKASMQNLALILALLLAVLSLPPSANAGENIPSTKKLGKNADDLNRFENYGSGVGL